jgi:hypothetical protein
MKLFKKLYGKIEMYFVNKWLHEALTPLQRAQVLSWHIEKTFDIYAALCITNSFTAGEFIRPYELVAFGNDGKVYGAKDINRL